MHLYPSQGRKNHCILIVRDRVLKCIMVVLKCIKAWVQIMGGLGGLSPLEFFLGGLAMDPAPQKKQSFSPPLFVI